MKLLAVSGSPRKRSNSRALMEAFLAGAEAAGAEVQRIEPARMQIAPCIACDGCHRHGRCVVQDDFQTAYQMILDCDAVVLATPIYFAAVSAQVKSFIDRCQCLWALRYVLKAPMPPAPAGQPRRGVLIITSGHRSPKMLEGAHQTFRFFMDALQGPIWTELWQGEVDEAGAISGKPQALERARLLGGRLARGESAQEAAD